MSTASPPLMLPSQPIRLLSSLRAAEETHVFLPTHSKASAVTLFGHGLTYQADSQRRPYLQEVSEMGVLVRLTDWVGLLTFETHTASGLLLHPVLVHPAKLAAHPEAAFAALARMADALPTLGAALSFPQVLLPTTAKGAAGTSDQLPAAFLEQIARRAWPLWQAARRLPQVSSKQAPRVISGGMVPDRVDWNLTLEYWAGGGFPAHVVRELPPLLSPPSAAAFAELWDHLIAAAAQLRSSTEHQDLSRRFRQARASLPSAPNAGRIAAPTDALGRAAQALTQELRATVRRSAYLPTGHLRMAELYEVWAMARLAEALGATEGEFKQDQTGLYTGTLHGPRVSVTLNPKLMYSGVGSASNYLRPDVLAVFDNGSAVVADVKYRRINNFDTEKQRQLNDQLLRYMGLSQAATGVVVWPGPSNERSSERHTTQEDQAQRQLRSSELPGGRARLVRLCLHPNDPPLQLALQLAQLNLPI